MTEKICYTIERHMSGISLAGTTKYAPVAQLDRALDSDSKGRWFESSRAYQDKLTNFDKKFVNFLLYKIGQSLEPQ